MFFAYDVIGDWISWKVGNDRIIIIGFDAWIGGSIAHKIPNNMIDHLTKKGYIFLYKIQDISLSSPIHQEWLNVSHIGFIGEDNII